MKLNGDRIDGFVARPDPKVRVILIYGPDEGLSRERLNRLTKTVVEDLSDPFRVAELTGPQIVADPAILSDEAAAMALTGGRRVVRVREATDAIAKTVQALLDEPVGDTLILLHGGDLAAKGALRKLIEAAPNAAALPCYADEGGALSTVIRDTLAAHRLAADQDAMDFLQANLGGDRQVSRSELEKLITYMGGQSPVTLDDAMACIGDVSALSLDALPLAVADGNAGEAQRLLDRLVGEGNAVIRLIRVLSGHFMRLHLVGGAMAAGKSQDMAIGLLRPPLFFKAKSSFIGQLRKWPPARAAQAIDLLLQAEIDCKQTGAPDYEILARTILNIARAAQRPVR